jgi:uncharacterized protein YjbI with pentapeptide repeats
LSNANLSGADLKLANLSLANLSLADVNQTVFAYNLGLSEAMKHSLSRRGAIFEDTTGNCSQVVTPR